MDIVKKEAPINDKNNTKKAGYYISDNLSLFYYKYIFRNASKLNIMDSEAFYKRYIEKDFESQYVSKAFEQVCKQYLIRQNRLGLTDEIFEEIIKEVLSAAATFAVCLKEDSIMKMRGLKI